MKKGQVSIFIIIGVILLLLAAIFIFVSNRSSQIPGGVDNTELSPVINYVDSCIEQTATQGLVKLGRQGRLYSNAYLTSDIHYRE